MRACRIVLRSRNKLAYATSRVIGVLKGIFSFREGRFFIQELCGLQVVNCSPEVRLRDPAHGLEKGLFDISSNNRGALE